MTTTTTVLADKPINRMGFGAMQLAGPGVFGPPPDQDGCSDVAALDRVEPRDRSSE
ncbi:MAG: hypothetical protein QOI71_1024 [Gaiellales bacterium]|nr:hypothetical protein [Gaiellales bacterium]